jgi:23S rRNA (cytidine1920-2'-O)/16S rRNA (cytidine1409-2'-O)-methyltransferase
LPFVSRGGLKLQHALTAFALDVQGRVALDVGASTGGFSDCLLQAGAARVYAVDVGYGQLAEKLRTDPRVVNRERTNIRTLESLGEAVSLIVIDASFISLRLVLPAALRFLGATGDVVALIKPQFEVGKGRVGKGGVVRDPSLHEEVTEQIRALCSELALTVGGVVPSPITGQKKGNVEFLIHAYRR